MSNIDKQALRETAEKATSGKWERGDGNGNGGELFVYCDDALGSAVCEMTSEYSAIPKYQRINNLNFIAAANPATVLALLDDNAKLLREKDAMEAAALALRDDMRLAREKLEIAEKRNAEQADIIAKQEKWIKDVEAIMIAATDRAEAAEKRIAELEALQGKPVMFIDGDISSADADKLAAVIREFNEETETPAARMARIIRENPHPTNMCDMPSAGTGKGDHS